MIAEVESKSNHGDIPVMETQKNATSFTKEILNAPLNLNIVKDIDGNIYRTIKIGNQEWMLDDLRIHRFDTLLDDYPITGVIPKLLDTNYNYQALGEDIPQIYLYCHFAESVFGLGIYAYNWHACHFMKNVMPKGWHLPSKEEWEIAGNFIKNNGCMLSNGSKPNRDIRKVLKLFEYGSHLNEIIPDSYLGLLNKYGYWLSSSINPFRQDQTWAFFSANDDTVKIPNSYLHKSAAYHVRFVKSSKEQIPLD